MSPQRSVGLGPETNLRQIFSMAYRGVLNIELLVDILRKLKKREITVMEALEEIAD